MLTMRTVTEVEIIGLLVQPVRPSYGTEWRFEWPFVNTAARVSSNARVPPPTIEPGTDA